MPITLHANDAFPLTTSDVEQLWNAVCEHLHVNDEHVSVKCVSKEEIQMLNKRYREKDTPTNVLTFSYDEDDVTEREHDIALCMEVAIDEAQERGVAVRDYTALLLVHAFLHAVGMDHERSDDEAQKTREIEQTILSATGFTPIAL